jgi:hypothetical protein
MDLWRNICGAFWCLGYDVIHLLSFDCARNSILIVGLNTDWIEPEPAAG